MVSYYDLEKLLSTFILSMTILCNGLLTPLPTAVSSDGNQLTKSILVIGGTGRVGRALIPRLIRDGFNVRVMCRDLTAAKTLEELLGAELVQGDVCSMESLVSATVGCHTVIDVHGMKPARFAKITDLFTHPKNIPYHPYNINYLGVKRLLAAMEINKVNKIVRITGAFIDTSAFIPLRALFNLILSFTSKWHEASELAIRNSGLDYTVLRPTEIVNKTSLSSSTNSSLVLLPGDAGDTSIGRGEIPISDLADLLLLSVQPTENGGQMLSKSTAVCNTKSVPGPTDWTELVKTIPQDHRILRVRQHKLAALLYGTGFLSVFSLFSLGTFKALKFIVQMVIALVLKIQLRLA